MYTLSTIHYIFIFFIFSIVKQIHCDIDSNNINQIKINEQNLEYEKKVEFDKHQEFKKQQEQKLHEWIINEINQQQNIIDIQPTQSNMFLLKNQRSLKYKLSKGLYNKILVRITVFEISNIGMITIRENPQKQNFIQLFSSSENGVTFSQCKVYIQKTLQIIFKNDQTQKVLQFMNPTPSNLLIQFSLQHQQLTLSPLLLDSKFQLTHNKISSILSQTKSSQLNRQHQYKYQLGFYQKVQRHQTDMYGFTIAQLIIIFGTSAVQLYCLKNIVDEELVI